MKKIICTLLLVLLSLSLFGCEALGVDTTETIKNYVQEYLEEKKTETGTGIADIMENASNVLFAGDEELENEFFEMLADFDYEIGSVELTEAGAKVDVTITTYDYRTFFVNYITDYLTNALTIVLNGADKDEFIKKSAETLKTRLTETKEAGKTVSTDITLTITQDDEGNYVLDAESSGDAITNAVLGGVVDILNSYAKEPVIETTGTDSEEKVEEKVEDTTEKDKK